MMRWCSMRIKSNQTCREGLLHFGTIRDRDFRHDQFGVIDSELRHGFRV